MVVTKRRDILKQIKNAADAANLDWVLDRSGGNHAIYELDGLMIPIPNHAEIGANLTVKIYKECAAKLGEDWWK